MVWEQIARGSSLLFSALVVCVVDWSPLHLFIRLSGSSDSGQETKTESSYSLVDWMKIGNNKIKYSSGGDTGEEPKLGLQESPTRWHTSLHCLSLLLGPYPSVNIATNRTIRCVLLGKWFFLYIYASALLGLCSNKYVRPFVWGEKKESDGIYFIGTGQERVERIWAEIWMKWGRKSQDDFSQENAPGTARTCFRGRSELAVCLMPVCFTTHCC